MWTWISLAVLLASTASAAVVTRRGPVSALSTAQIKTFTPYSFFAATAYCKPSTTINWSCGCKTHTLLLDSVH